MPDIIRTPDEQFENLVDFPFAPHYIEVGDTRMHYVEEGDGNETILCLHGEPSWSFLYRHMIPPLVAAGHKVVAPDLVGFGRSDKYTKKDDYTFAVHAEKLNGLIAGLDLQNITVVVQDWGGLLGLNAVRLMPDRFSRLVIMNTFLPTGAEAFPDAFLQWQAFAAKMENMSISRVINGGTVTDLSEDVLAGYDAPFPDISYKAGALVFPALVPTKTDMAGAADMQATREALSTWDKPAQVMFSDQDPIMRGGNKFFLKLIPTAKEQPEITIEGGGHFLQEDKGAAIAQHIIEFIQRTS